MTTVIVQKNAYEMDVKELESRFQGVRFIESDFMDMDESYPVLFRVEDNSFYRYVTFDMLKEVIKGHRNELKVQTSRLFHVEMKTYVSEPQYRGIVKDIYEMVKVVEPFDRDTLKDEIEDYIEETDIQEHYVCNSVKMALLKTIKGPRIYDLMVALGREEVLHRMEKYFDKYKYRM